MSKREDIVDGSEAVGKQYGLVYTCNLGWLDLGHMNPREVQPKCRRRGPVAPSAGGRRQLPGAPLAPMI